MNTLLRAIPLMARVGVPILLVATWMVHAPYGWPEETVESFSITFFVLAVILWLAHHIINKRRPKKLLISTGVTLAAAAITFGYIHNFTEGFEGLAVYVYIVAPLFVLGMLQALISLYVNE